LHQEVGTSENKEPPSPLSKISALDKLPSPPDCGRLLWDGPLSNFILEKYLLL